METVCLLEQGKFLFYQCFVVDNYIKKYMLIEANMSWKETIIIFWCFIVKQVFLCLKNVVDAKILYPDINKNNFPYT